VARRGRLASRMEVRVKGRLDGFRAQDLAGELDRAVKAGEREVRVDLGEVTFSARRASGCW